MKRGFAVLAVVAMCALIAVGAGCGSDDEPDDTTATTETTTTDTTDTTTDTGTDTDAETGEEPIQVETVDPPAPLPSDWTQVTNEDAGFSIGLPPAWTERPVQRADGSVLRSPDDLIVVTVTADRSEGAQALPLDEFAQRTAEALGSDIVGSERFRNLRVFGLAPFDHTYEATAVRAVGTPAGSDAQEMVLVVAIRRGDFATYVVVARENAEESSQFGDRDTIKRVIRSLRGRPPA